MTITKERAATVAYGRGRDSYRTPARYAVLDAAGTKVGIILGSATGYMESTKWEVCWVSPTTGMPRVVYYAKSYRDAKAWAMAWDGRTNVRPEWRA